MTYTLKSVSCQQATLDNKKPPTVNLGGEFEQLVGALQSEPLEPSAIVFKGHIEAAVRKVQQVRRRNGFIGRCMPSEHWAFA
jgi:hypothetical protein